MLVRFGRSRVTDIVFSILEYLNECCFKFGTWGSKINSFGGQKAKVRVLLHFFITICWNKQPLFKKKKKKLTVGLNDPKVRGQSRSFALKKHAKITIARPAQALRPLIGDQQTVGSLVPLCDIRFPNISPWKFVLIWKCVLLSSD